MCHHALIVFFVYRYVTILTLVRVRTEQMGRYTVFITNEDDSKEVTFDLKVRGELCFALLLPLGSYYLSSKQAALLCF